ncbi:MAG TPA: DUF5667 domain-containing protein [Patescibacteria group bacterium]|nr:DUF5667 domain-containing protein [Patescibacteria group bacterium]
MRKSFIFCVLLFLIVSQGSAFAQEQAVLGVETQPAVMPSIPPTSEGPGLLLPDSPFFFLDKLKQKLRVKIAFTNENRAKVHASIAGERWAELRYMLARNNKDGVFFDLQGVSSNFDEASTDLSKAKFDGRDVAVLAKNLNLAIKEKQQVLDNLDKQSKGELSLEVRRVQASLLNSKLVVENLLPAEDLRNEVVWDLQRKIQMNLVQASESATFLKKDLDQLQKQGGVTPAKKAQDVNDSLTRIQDSIAKLKAIQDSLNQIKTSSTSAK